MADTATSNESLAEQTGLEASNPVEEFMDEGFGSETEVEHQPNIDQSKKPQADQTQQPSGEQNSGSRIREDAVSFYGFTPEAIQNIPDAQLQRLMDEVDHHSFSGSSAFPSNGWGQQQQQQFQQSNQQGQQPQQQQQLPPGMPNFDDPDVFDEHTASAFKYMNSQLSQLTEQLNMERMMQKVSQFQSVVDSLGNETYGSDSSKLNPAQMQQRQLIAGAVDQILSQHPNADIGRAVRYVTRLMNPMANPELRNQATQRQSQFAGQPSRSANGQFQSAEQAAQAKLDEYRSGSAREQFL